MAVNTLPARSDIADEHKWNIEAIYPQDTQWESDFNALGPLVDELNGYKGRLGESDATLLAALQRRDQIGQNLTKLFSYARMRRDEDNTNAQYQALTDRAQSLWARVQEAGAYFSPELLEVGQDKIDEFLQNNEQLRMYEHEMEDLFRQAKHLLSEQEEALLAGVSEIAAGPETTYDMLTSADMTYGTIKDEEGSVVELSQGRYFRYVRSADRRVREEAFHTFHNAFHKNRNTIASTYATQVKSDIFHAKARKYNSSLEASLSHDNIPTTVYTGLIEAVHENMPLMDHYLELRKRVLGLEELHLWDLHVPLVQEADEAVPYERATEMVTNSLEPMGADYMSGVREGFSSRWTDVFETNNKTSGAYSWGVYGVHPFMLLNYQDDLRYVFTLAHEMGHSMHTYFSFKTQPFVYSEYTLFVAEVASTLNEEMLIHHLLQTTESRAVKLAVINYSLEQFRSTLFRQTMFAEYEKIAHERAEAGEALTADLLSEIHYDLNKLYYGKSIVVDEDVAIEWARIPHFYSSFYVYKYATGISAANALSQQIIHEGQPAVDRYLNFLSKGGSDYSINLLRDAGVDMTSREPVRQALHMFGTRLDQMEALLKDNE